MSDRDPVTAPLRRNSLPEQVANQLRDDILSGRIAPEERLTIAPITKRFGVSHIPVREAMRALEAEGLLEASATGSMRASGASIEDLKSLYDIRRLIECQLSHDAGALFTDAQIAEVFGLLTKLLSEEEGSDNYWVVHRAFHKALLVPRLSQWYEIILTQLWRASERYLRLYTYRFGSYTSAMDQHRRLAEACATRDGAALSTLTREHLLSTQEAIESGYARLHADRAADTAEDA